MVTLNHTDVTFRDTAEATLESHSTKDHLIHQGNQKKEPTAKKSRVNIGNSSKKDNCTEKAKISTVINTKENNNNSQNSDNANSGQKVHNEASHSEMSEAKNSIPLKFASKTSTIVKAKAKASLGTKKSKCDECTTKNLKSNSRAAAKPNPVTAAKSRSTRGAKKYEDHEEKSEIDIKHSPVENHNKIGSFLFGFQSAKTSRAKCYGKSCKIININQGTIKFCEFKGIKVFGFHVECVSNEQKANVLRWAGSFSDLQGYDLLDRDDISYLKKI